MSSIIMTKDYQTRKANKFDVVCRAVCKTKPLKEEKSLLRAAFFPLSGGCRVTLSASTLSRLCHEMSH